MFILQLHSDIYSVLIEKNHVYFYVVWFVHKLWLVQPAFFDGAGHRKQR